MNEINIESAQYYDDPMVPGDPDGITAVIDGTVCYIPLDSANHHYAEIMRQVEAGILVIQPADTQQEAE